MLEVVTVLTLVMEDPIESVVVTVPVEVITTTALVDDVDDGVIVDVDELVVLEPALSVVGKTTMLVDGDEVVELELEGSAEVVVLVIVEPLESVVVSVMAVELPDADLHVGQW